MRAQMATGMFQYEPCDLRVIDKILQVTLLQTERTLRISTVTEASMTRNQSGLYQLQLSTPQQQYEFLVEDAQMAQDALAVLLELTKGNSRLELRSIQ